LARLAEKAITRGWFQAAARIRPQIVRALNELGRSLREVEDKLSPIRPGALASLGGFHAELAGLFAEFHNRMFNTNNTGTAGGQLVAIASDNDCESAESSDHAAIPAVLDRSQAEIAQ